MKVAALLVAFLASASAYVMAPTLRGDSLAVRSGRSQVSMVTITDGVEFDTIAREWRLKWSADDDKKSLQEAQAALDEILPELKALPGVKSVNRVVCGGCLDFKVITSLDAAEFGAWEEKQFAPEESFLSKVKNIKGTSFVETQTFTFMPM